LRFGKREMKVDARFRKRRVDLAHEVLERGQHVLRGFPRVDVVAPGEDDDHPGLAGNHDPLRVPGRVGHLGPAEAAIEDRQIGKGLAEIPEADRGTAHEDDAPASRRSGAVLRLERADVGLPAVLKRQRLDQPDRGSHHGGCPPFESP
jgi:hypothetical protein